MEVLVEAAGRAPLDPLTRALLAALPLADVPTAVGLDRLLLVGEERVDAALADASRAGWVETAAGGRASVSAAGRDVLDHGRPVAPVARRRFAFRNGHFVPLPDQGPLTYGPSGGRLPAAPYGLPLVRRACDQPAGWKHDAGFPETVDRVVEPSADLTAELRWRAVPVEGEALLGLVAVADAALPRVRGYVPDANWSLPAEPTFTLAGDPARAAFPELFTEPSEADCRAAWLGWVKFRTERPEDVAACAVTLDRDRLVVRSPARLVDWLQAHRADVLTGDTWVWVGTGQLRRPAVIDIRRE